MCSFLLVLSAGSTEKTPLPQLSLEQIEPRPEDKALPPGKSLLPRSSNSSQEESNMAGYTHRKEGVQTDDSSTGDLTFMNTSMFVPQPYQVQFATPLPPNLIKSFNLHSLLILDQKRTVACRELAEVNAAKDAEVLRDICCKAGYFDADVTFEVLEKAKGLTITFKVRLGERYRVCDKSIKGSASDFPERSTFLAVSKLEYVDHVTILEEKHRLRTVLVNHGYYFVVVDDPLVYIDRENKTAQVVYTFAQAIKATIADITVKGEANVPRRFIVNRLPLKKGATLTECDRKEARESLMQTGLFSNIEISATKGEYARQAQDIPTHVTVKVKPLPPRAVGLGCYISASEGFLGSVLWQNKNFLNRAWDVGVSARGGKKEMASRAFLDIPDIFARRQKLRTEVTFRHLNTLAYEGNQAALSVGIIQDFRVRGKRMSCSILPTAEYGALKRDRSIKSTLFGIPLEFNLERTNHRYSPTSGWGISLTCKPYFGSFEQVAGEVKSNSSDSKVTAESTPEVESANPAVEGGAQTSSKNEGNNKTSTEISSLNTVSQNSHTISLTKGDKKCETPNSMTILSGHVRAYYAFDRKTDELNVSGIALYAAVATVLIKDVSYIPFDKRFYGGGRGLMRSYGYQMCSRLDSQDKPTGGASLFAACLEPRLRLSKDVGFVLFGEVCCVSDSKWPKFSKADTRLWGGGLGIRYFTRFGPIRFDLAFPFKRRISQKKPGKKADRAFQFYLSAGQCF